MCFIHLSPDESEEIFIVHLGHSDLSVLKKSNQKKTQEWATLICGNAVCLLGLFYAKSRWCATVIHFVLPTQDGSILESRVWKARRVVLFKLKVTSEEKQKCGAVRSIICLQSAVGRNYGTAFKANVQWANKETKIELIFPTPPRLPASSPSPLATWQCGVKCVLWVVNQDSLVLM